jgi:phospholipase C
MTINRRDFIRGAAGAASGAALAGAQRLPQQHVNRLLPRPEASNIEHIVVVMMENRSFDHLLGWLPGANGQQAGLSYLDNSGEAHPTQRLTTYVGCNHPDPDHSYAGGRSEYNNGQMDGWLRTSDNDTFSIGYYEEADLPFYAALARNFTTLDNYFASILSSTFPNRVFQHAAQTDRLSNTLDISALPTIWDNLALFSDFLAHAAAGTLPAVSFLDPRFTILDDGSGNDDHPHADLRAGEHFLGQVYRALASGPGWQNTVLIVNRDEWGGFYDTVTPPRVTAPNDVDTDLVNGQALLGCRVPVFVVSPFSKGTPATPRIDSNLYDHTSVLKFIEWRYSLPPLTSRDASDEVANLVLALDFNQPDNSVPELPVIHQPFPNPCGLFSLGNLQDNESYDFHRLQNSHLTTEWRKPL